MKRATVVICIVLIATAARGQLNSSNTLQSDQYQNTTVIGGGNADSASTAIAQSGTSQSSSVAEGGNGIGWSDSQSAAVVNLSTTSNIRNRTAPLGTYPPYLPLWNHGGWGTVNAYFPNGPTTNDGVYQRSFDPSSEEDMRELRRILTALPYAGPLEALGGVVNGFVTLFGGPPRYHHGRGFEIANSLVRDRRPEGKPLFVFIDSYVDPQLLADAGYAYVGRVSLEGEADRNWDHVYSAAAAEALPWDVDLLLVSGGMKGVTVGSNISFPSAAGGYSQLNYSLSLFGGHAKGITEGKGEAVLSASGYRYDPSLIQRRRIPQALFQTIRRPLPVAAASVAPVEAGPQVTAEPVPKALAPAAQERPTVPEIPAAARPGIEVSKQLYDMAGLRGTVDHVTVK